MTKPEDTEGRSFRYQVAAIARDVSAISATVVILAAVFWFFAAPWLKPWLEIPEKLAQIEVQLAPLARPKLIEFQGVALVDTEKTYAPGDEIRFVFNLRRNADCATEIGVSWFSIETGSRVTTSTGRAVQAPITEDFAPFVLTRTVPETLSDGKWVYYPRITPINCGIYRSYNGNMSEIFEIKRGE